MHWIDLSIFFAYMLIMLSVGVYFMRKNNSHSDYYVGGRSLNKWHIGLSVVATDVGGGFSIGLGGLGFTMGLSGSWMLFTGLIGAWLSAAILIPTVHRLGLKKNLTTFPQIFGHFYNPRVALVAGIISAIGYIGFTASQLLAGAKLAAASFEGLETHSALWIMGTIAVVYTSFGGMKAVIYTDTVQWIILLAGLLFIGIPLGLSYVGGWEAVSGELSNQLLRLDNVDGITLFNWSLTIIPIWFIGMTLYQRIYASKSESEAKKAWYIAGVLEWPIMAFMGTALGLLARMAFDNGLFMELGYPEAQGLDPEMGLPLFLRTILPIGLMGLMMSAYFSAILSTADSCLMAASGNILTDIVNRFRSIPEKAELRWATWITLSLGLLSVLLATSMNEVLDLMLKSYAFMVSGLFVPLMMALFRKRVSSLAALSAMILGGIVTLVWDVIKGEITLFPSSLHVLNEVDSIAYGLIVSLGVFTLVNRYQLSKIYRNSSDANP